MDELERRYKHIVERTKEYCDEWLHSPEPFNPETAENDIDAVLEDIRTWLFAYPEPDPK